mmetsp:Transcript_11384/g.26344  ORF Transcript_11384/g.26344 Transcript_11384/m.26344 type:complete len:128 (+) Transcript_11384:1169-1552(+)
MIVRRPCSTAASSWASIRAPALKQSSLPRAERETWGEWTIVNVCGQVFRTCFSAVQMAFVDGPDTTAAAAKEEPEERESEVVEPEDLCDLPVLAAREALVQETGEEPASFLPSHVYPMTTQSPSLAS